MKTYQVILDTNVLVAAFRSIQGASFRLLRLFIEGDSRWELNVSTALVLEYEAVLKRERHRQGKDMSFVDAFLDDLVAGANRRSIFFLLRPYLRDIDDDFVLELAFASAADYIISYNTKNFTEAKRIGIETVTPHEFLRLLGETL